MLDVAIVGSGPAGLTAAILLLRQGLTVRVFEKNPGLTNQMRATLVNTRTMEVLRSLDLAAAVHAREVVDAVGRVRWSRTFAGRDLATLDITTVPGRAEVRAAASPARWSCCAQDGVEQVLLDALAQHGVTVDFGAEVIGLEQDDDAVRVSIRREPTTEVDVVPCSFVIAADGAASPVRSMLGIEMIGPAELAKIVGISFDADLRRWFEPRPSLITWVANDTASGAIVTQDGIRRWVFQATLPGRGGQRITTDEATDIVRAAIGVDDIAIKVQSIKPWRTTAQIASDWRKGRVLLAGDAAHRFPPTGGFGMNTGIQDAHNLAWKIAAVVRGRSRMELLDSYEAERRPVAQSNTEWSMRNLLSPNKTTGPGLIASVSAIDRAGPDQPRLLQEFQLAVNRERNHFDALGQDLGGRYGSAVLIPDGTIPPTPDNPVDEYWPSAAPGNRAPHIWLERWSDGETRQVSILDLFQEDFVVLYPADAIVWAKATDQASASTGLTVKAYPIGSDSFLRDSGDFAGSYGISTGIVLIRPDGYVAWRALVAPEQPAAALANALLICTGSLQAADSLR